MTFTIDDLSGYVTVDLVPGDTDSQDVLALQNWLVKNGLLTQAQVDSGPGVYGPATTAAVASLQQQLGVDAGSSPGFYGLLTRATIQAEIDALTPDVTPNPDQLGMILIEQFEGFSANAYLDSDGNYRVGYGDDTYAVSNGSGGWDYLPVTETTTTTVAAATAELQHRLDLDPNGGIPGIERDLGSITFLNLSPLRQGVLESIAWNYGSFQSPALSTVVADLKNNSSYDQIANDIQALADNPSRRAEEAALFRWEPPSGGDTTAPLITSVSPTDNSTSVAVDTNITLTFSETVLPGSGNLLIYNLDGTIAKTIDVTDSSQVTFSGNTVTINPSTDLAASSSYHVNIASGAIVDMAGNSYAGISDITDFNFTTGAVVDNTAPIFVNDTPLTVTTGGTAVITSNLLSVSDPDNTDAQLTYSIVTPPSDGILLKDGSPTSSFTQADIDNGQISYQENASNASSDFFTFHVSDPAGNTTDDTPFQITIGGKPNSTVINSIADLENINNNLSGHYVLGANINASGFSFIPIGTSSAPFTGTLDGNGYTISNITINGGSDYTGLFGDNAGTIQNLGLTNESVAGGNVVGGLAGYNSGIISNSFVTGHVSGINDVGGLVGESMVYGGYISNSHSTAAVTGAQAVGGLVGDNEYLGFNSHVSITNSYATGGVTGHSYLGGLVGINGNSVIDGSHATGSVTGDANSYYIGGLAGMNITINGNSSAWITNSYATGAVVGGSSVGGLFGFTTGYVYTSYATGNVTGVDSVGGLAGAQEFSIISDSYARGSVTGTSSVGGLIGNSWEGGDVITSYSTGFVAGTSNVGGLFGSGGFGLSAPQSYWDVQTSGQWVEIGYSYNGTDPGGIGLTTTQFKSGLPSGFDPTVWGINSNANNGYPYLLWQVVDQPTPQLIGNEFRVNTYTAGDQGADAIAALGDGGFVVVWQSQDQGTAGLGVYGQLYDANGATVGNEFKISSSASASSFSSASLPAVATLKNGDFVVIWSHGNTGPVGNFGQLYDSSGNPIGGEFAVNVDANYLRGSPSVAALADGGFVVAWESYFQDGSLYGIYAQRFSANGTPISGEFQVNTYTQSDQSAPSVAGLKDGGFIIVWHSNGQDGSGNGVYGQRFDASGHAVGNEFQVNTYTDNNQERTSVAAISNGGFVVTWTSVGQDGNASGIYAQVFDADGGRVASEFQVNTTVAGDQLNPHIAALADGGFVIDWTSNGQDGSGNGVYGQRFDASGHAVGNEFQVNTYTDNNQSGTSISGLPNGEFVAIWDSAGQDGSGSGVYGQRFAVNSDTAPVIVINSVADLENINNDLSGNYVLGANIDATGINFTSISNFTGTFDGNGHTISNLSLLATQSQNAWGYAGLFDVIGPSGVVENLKLTNLSITGGNAYVGALAAENDGTIKNVSADVSIDVTGGWVGGLVGENLGTVFQSDTSGSVIDNNSPYPTPLVGGLVGYNCPSSDNLRQMAV
jgi:GH24 family phage-related lysozyme (muramidase)